MISAKEQMTQIINNLPVDATYDEIMRELAFERMVKQGMQDSREKRLIDNEDMQRRIQSWQN
jgi:hypothetical protein